CRRSPTPSTRSARSARSPRSWTITRTSTSGGAHCTSRSARTRRAVSRPRTCSWPIGSTTCWRSTDLALFAALPRIVLGRFGGAQRLFGLRDHFQRLHLARLVDLLPDDPVELLARLPEQSHTGLTSSSSPGTSSPAACPSLSAKRLSARSE